jgi:hypothetical protein
MATIVFTLNVLSEASCNWLVLSTSFCRSAVFNIDLIFSFHLALCLLQACEFYIANVWLLPKSIQDVYPNASQPSIVNQAAIQSDGNRIAIESGAEVVFKSTNSFEVYGTEKVTKRAVEKILELDMVKNSQVEIRFQVELACEHRDFISGKKNGKVSLSLPVQAFQT